LKRPETVLFSAGALRPFVCASGALDGQGSLFHLGSFGVQSGHFRFGKQGRRLIAPEVKRAARDCSVRRGADSSDPAGSRRVLMRTIDRFLPTLFVLTAWSVLGTSAFAADAPVERPVAVPRNDVTIDDAFWSPKLTTWRTVTVEDCFNKFEKDGAFRNFDHIARGELDAPHGGPPWY